jgi:glycosyltransferase involved in cell wall biosynthesis
VISVIIPVYNEAKALPRTLEHLFQQEGEFEVLAVDGGSTDVTREVMAGFPLVRVSDAPNGRASQMNRGAVSA